MLDFRVYQDISIRNYTNESSIAAKSHIKTPRDIQIFENQIFKIPIESFTLQIDEMKDEYITVESQLISGNEFGENIISSDETDEIFIESDSETIEVNSLEIDVHSNDINFNDNKKTVQISLRVFISESVEETVYSDEFDIIKTEQTGVSGFYVIGGWDENNNRLSTVRNWTGEEWVSIPNMSKNLNQLGSAIRENSEIFVLGGRSGGTSDDIESDVEKWNGDKWVSLPDMNTPRYNFAAEIDKNGYLYAIGGQDGSHDRLAEVERWNGQEWKVLDEELSETKREFSSATDGNGNIYVLGGRTAWWSEESTVEKWDGESWSTFQMPDSIEEGTAVGHKPYW